MQGGEKKEHLSDELRAISNFKIEKSELVELVNEYKSRKYDEDICGAENLGGADGLASKLNANLVSGLTGKDFPERTAAFGNNFREEVEAKTFCSIFWEALDDFMMKVLIVAATGSLVFGYLGADPSDYGHVWIDSVAIYLAVLVVTGVGSIIDYAKEQEFAKRTREENAGYKVPIIRDGVETNMHVNHVHCGDIMVLKVGIVIPVDGLIIESEQVSCNEAAMTGESDACKKETLETCIERRTELAAEGGEKGGAKKTDAHALPSPVILSGTEVVSGKGKMLVVMVGDNSALGMIMAKLKQKAGLTPLQKKLTIIATNVGLLGTYFALLTVHVLMVRYFIDGVTKRQIKLFETVLAKDGVTERSNFFAEFLQWVEFFTIGVAVVVVAIPEGLPLAVILSLAYSQRMMLKDNNNVKKLQACEVMGGATNICSDKTGTLTLNQMKVTKVWLGKDISIPADQDPVTKKMLPIKAADYFSDNLWKVLEMSIACNIPPPDDFSATDKGIADLVERAGTNLEDFSKKYLSDSIRFHFTSKRKRMTTIVTLEDGTRRLLIKGASEMVKNCCQSYLDASGNTQPLDDQINSEINSLIHDYASQALRTIAVAYKDLPADYDAAKDTPDEQEVKSIEKDGLTLIGILGIMDVIRTEVPEAVRIVSGAGVTVRMVTGDNIVTARAIAKLCNILNEQEANDESCSIEGPEFYKMMGGILCSVCKKSSPADCTCDEKVRMEQERIRNFAKFKVVAPKLKVMARSRPEDKYLLVTGLRNMDEVVAVTGDGTNDAPALSKANVGFGMGITGTQVCKAAADIIIIDDSFTAVVKACSWGRNVFDNIQRFLQFQLTVNVNALITVFICSALMKGTPLQAIQLLWVNLIMDSLAALALATEDPKPHLLQRPPQKTSDYIVSRKMTKHILYMAIYQFIVIFIVVFFGEYLIYEPMVEHKWNQDPEHCCVAPGREFDISGEPLWYAVRQVNGNQYSRHITFVFHFFVIMQVWNMVCCRKIHDEMNILSGITTNWSFVFIWLLIIVLQVLIIAYGSVAFRLSPDGLDWQQHLQATVIAFSVVIINAFIKCIPDRWAPKLGEDSVFERHEAKRLGNSA